MPHHCLDSRQRGQLQWINAGTLPIDDNLTTAASEKCRARGRRNFMLECPHNGNVEVWCPTKLGKTLRTQHDLKLDLRNCAGQPHHSPLMNEGKNGHCDGGGPGQSLGGWHRAAVYNAGCERRSGYVLNESTGRCERKPWDGFVSCAQEKVQGACPNGPDPNPIVAKICSLTCSI